MDARPSRSWPDLSRTNESAKYELEQKIKFRQSVWQKMVLVKNVM